MARFSRGWVAISRRLFLHDKQANEFYEDPALFCIWATLIAWANVVPSKIQRRGVEVTVARGEVVTTLGGLGTQWGYGIKVVRRCLDYLAKTGRIGIVDNTNGLHVKICKYEEYQMPLRDQGTEEDTVRARQGHGEGTVGARSGHGEGTIIDKETRETKGQGDNELAAGAPPAAAAEPPAKRPARARAPADPAKSTATWAAYSAAYARVHGTPPAPNKVTASQACRLVDLVGKDDAPRVAAHYVLNEREAWIVRTRHPFGELVKNYQKYLTNYRTGAGVTAGQARAAERDAGNRTVAEGYLARKHAQPGGQP